MDPPASPPKRVTRSRAAPKSSATSGTAASAAKSKPVAAASKTTRTTRTAAAPTAKSSHTVAAPSTRTSVKRKTRADDDEDESEPETAAKRQQPASRTATRATRGPGRPKKTVEPEPTPAPAPAPARATRGRPAKKAIKENVKEEEPTRATRTRTKKTQAGEDEAADDLAPVAPVKKPTRGRPAGTTTSTSAQVPKPVKKTVTFAEPDKENLAPSAAVKRKPVAAKAAEPTAAGMRAKPVRKPTTGRATRTAATKKGTNATEDKAPMPLSPKKVTQLSANRDIDTESEDELAMDKTPARAFRRSPVKPPVAMKPTDETKDEALSTDEGTEALAPTEPTILLGSPVRRPPPSPFKDSMKSPAKRVEGLQLGLPAIKESAQSANSPSKASLFKSPAKRCPVPINATDLNSSSRQDTIASSPFKQSLFQSPAKRPFSPMKSLRLPEPEPESIARSPAPTPVLLCTPFPAPAVDPVPAAEEQEEVKAGAEADAEDAELSIDEDATDDEDAPSSSAAEFNGRMSTVLPRAADPTLTLETSLTNESINEDNEDDRETVVLEREQEEEQKGVIESHSEIMVLDEAVLEGESVAHDSISTTPPNSPPKQALSMFGLQQRDTVSFDMSFTESEDELTRVMTPKSASPTKHMKGSIMRPRTSGFGFTPLAQRFDSWQAGSPLKNELKATTPKGVKSTRPRETRASLMQDDFFEDEMCVRPDTDANDSINEDDPLAGIPMIKDPIVEDISVTEEDLDLAAEANEMSMMSPEQVESMLNLDGHDDTMSDASQEYGDENEVPAGFTQDGTRVPPVTPQRTLRREVHTVSKIPLKPADESTPPPQPSLKKRRHSISRLPATRPTHGLTRSATVISYSPSHKIHVEPAFEEAAEEEETRSRAGSVPPVTPTKSEGWSNAVTPARTPRQDVDPALLRGAVVFVDVHTVEGADASAIFVELLTQMGARCVKSWNWNPNDEDASSKIGITHVVFKDGGKRTMEKVRETNGVVQCVGVGWVLDCERENEWLEEAPYYIDTSLIPRGGHRRRKSMEPKAVANHNGTLVPDSAIRKASSRESQTAPTTPAPANRRDSALWMHSPDFEDDEGDDGEEHFENFYDDHEDWFDAAPLTPVPKTPAPEAIRRFAMEATPGGADTSVSEADDEEDEELSQEELIQRTCPPKAQHIYENLGAGILGRSKDENVVRRLMDARRKSLAFAPKVSSPLAKSWKDWN
ncbi:hypothetical protein J7T55_002796 [Diaporthe amygdali]|uniref:uncharacterized protein n=1 Tax=Phomopsis amygdali TaxID=1214568 RepID=UPI0022FE417D|nr:uncharacterized protein J7T55_002796 [Diaporthe amygdali]KAJ0122284.1 hypothetical protein J7T55_002796 [Diaporthe amygdali]